MAGSSGCTRTLEAVHTSCSPPAENGASWPHARQHLRGQSLDSSRPQRRAVVSQRRMGFSTLSSRVTVLTGPTASASYQIPVSKRQLSQGDANLIS